jgi:hypothetical protein
MIMPLEPTVASLGVLVLIGVRCKDPPLKNNESNVVSISFPPQCGVQEA